MALLNAGRAADAEKKTRKLIRKYPDAIILVSLLGVALADQGKYGEAASCHTKVLRFVPDYAEAHYNLGVALMELDKLEEARASFETASRLKPSLTEAHNNLGIVLHKLGSLEKSVECYRQALKLKPDFADVHSNLAKTLLALERPEAALASCKDALRVAPGLTETRQIMGQALEKLGRLDEALDALNEEAELQPDNPNVGIHRARVLDKLGQPEVALGVYDGVLEHDATLVEAHVQRGLLLIELGRADEALKSFDAVLARQNPPSIRTIYALSQLPASMVDIDLLAMIDQAEPEDESESDFESMRAAILASELHRAGRYTEAWDNLVVANRDWSIRTEDLNATKHQERQAALTLLRNAPDAKTPDDVDGQPLSLHILGPSRSGKTTLERLVALLDGTTRGFESRIVSSAFHQAFERVGLPRTTPATEPSPELDAMFREVYFAELDKKAHGAQIFTSTPPASIVLAHPVARAIPNSRFVFMQRDTNDLCLRIYMKLYSGDNFYAYDIDNILEYVAWYDEMSTILAERYPQISKVIRYEELVAEPAAVLDSVADLCGTTVPGDVALPILHDDRGCAAPYKALIGAEKKKRVRSC